MKIQENLLCPRYRSVSGSFCLGRVFQKSLKYYQKINLGILKKEIIEVAKGIASHPLVLEIYGVGFPFYGQLDVEQRMRATSKKYIEKVGLHEAMIQRLLPDIDFLIVFSTEKGPYSLSDQTMQRMKESFVSASVSFNRQWGEIFSSLQKEFNIADRSLDPLEQFMEKGALHIDLAPIPSHIWQDIEVLVCLPQDIQSLPYIRDLMFTCEPLLRGKASEKPLNYRMNFILNVLSKGSYMTGKRLWQEILFLQQYKSLILNNPETEAVVFSRWQTALLEAKNQGLIFESEADCWQLSGLGQRRLSEVLSRREEIYDKGFTII